MPKALVIIFWVWIGIWLVYKFVQISNGYILDALDFSNPSLAGIITTVFIVLLIINAYSKKTPLPESEASTRTLPEINYTCPACEYRSSFQSGYCPNCKSAIPHYDPDSMLPKTKKLDYNSLMIDHPEYKDEIEKSQGLKELDREVLEKLYAKSSNKKLFKKLSEQPDNFTIGAYGIMLAEVKRRNLL